MSLSYSKIPILPFYQNWVASAADETNGYMNNFITFPAGQRFAIQVLSCSHPRASHIRLFVTTDINSDFINLKDDDFAADRDATWQGLIVLDNVTSIGAQVYNITAGDRIILKGIYQVYEP